MLLGCFCLPACFLRSRLIGNLHRTPEGSRRLQLKLDFKESGRRRASPTCAGTARLPLRASGATRRGFSSLPIKTKKKGVFWIKRNEGKERYKARPSGERNQQSPPAAHPPSRMQSKAPNLLWSMPPVLGASVRADSVRSKTRGCAQETFPCSPCLGGKGWFSSSPSLCPYPTTLNASRAQGNI